MISTAFSALEIPSAMRGGRRWVNWKPVQRDGKWTKVPICPVTRMPASSTDPKSWSDFATCVATAGAFNLGIGFVLGEGWLGVDFDHCADAKEGVIEDQWIREWATSTQTYVEYSPSGTGIHAIFRDCVLPEWSQNRRDGVEVYERSRFFCVTGNAFASGRDCTASQASVDAVCSRYLRKDVQPQAAPTKPVAPLTINHSSDDWRLCCALTAAGFGQDAIEYQLRAKMLADGRETKLARLDYVPRTVEAAMKHVPAVEVVEPAKGLEFLPVREVLDNHKEQTPYAIHGVLRAGEVMALIAPPKCHKSFLMHDLAISTALGRKWFGEHACTEGRVLLVDNELTLETMSFRLRTIMEACRYHIDSLTDKLEVLALRENDANLDAVLRGILARDVMPNLVIFDAFYMFIDKGMDENSNADIAEMIRKFRRFASRSGAAVVLVHHSSKGSQAGKEPIDTGSGAGSMGRAVDSHMAIRKHSEDNTYRVDYTLRTSMEPEAHAIEWVFPRYRSCSVDDIDALEKPKKAAKP